MTTPRFRSFEPGLLGFLDELAANNERDWFRANKRRYEAEVVAPAMAFIEAMGPRLHEISPHFLAVPRKTGGSMMRIYRDTRFSSDKRPYKTNVGIQFRHEAGRDVHAPGFYVHLEPTQVFLGAGIWRPGSQPLAEIRAAIDSRPQSWEAARHDPRFARTWSLGGDTLKRAPRGYREDHPLIADLKRKDFIASRELSEKSLYRADIADRMADAFARSRPFVAFLCEALDLPF